MTREQEQEIEKDHYSNLNRSNKWLGIIEYKSLIILLVILFFTWSVLDIFMQNQIYRVYLLVIIAIPFRKITKSILSSLSLL